jgi:hypothetical protein
VTAARDEGQPQRQAPKKQAPPPPEPVELGVYVAKEALYVDGARAFAAGDIVPAEHVNKFGWQALVREFDDNEGED